MLSKKNIEQIKERIIIEDVIKDYVQLKKSGHNLVCCCPFHKERTPSFFIFPKNNSFKCFGCGEAGDAITFIKKIENVDFVDALEILAKKYNITIDDDVKYQNEEYKKKEAAIIFLDNVKKYFCNNLTKNEDVKTYLQQRKINNDTINVFSFGYSVSTLNDLFEELKNKKTDINIANELGLIYFNNYKNIYVDKFRNRIMLPLQDHNGNTVGFAGRIISDDKSDAKYINSPESFLYHKSNILFGLYQAKQYIREQQKCYIVEGYFDAISLYQCGVKNVVASCGTSLTESQCKILRRFADTVTVFYDSDEAGRKATERAIELLLKSEFMVNIVDYDEYKDPDEIVNNNDVNIFLKTHENDFITFLSKKKTDNITHNAHLLKRIKDLVAFVKDDSYRTLLVTKIKKTFDITTVRFTAHSNNYKVADVKKIDVIEAYEKELLRLLLIYGNDDVNNTKCSVIEHMSEHLKKLTFTNIQNETIKEACLGLISKNNFSINNVLLCIDDDVIKKIVVDITTSRQKISDQWFTDLNIDISDEKRDIISNIDKNIARYQLRLIHKNLIEQAKLLHGQSSDDKEKILKNIEQLKKQEQNLAKQLGITLL